MDFYKTKREKTFYSAIANKRYLIPTGTILLLDITSLKEITEFNVHSILALIPLLDDGTGGQFRPLNGTVLRLVGAEVTGLLLWDCHR